MRTCKKCGEYLDEYMFYSGNRICKNCQKAKKTLDLSEEEILKKEEEEKAKKRMIKIDKLMMRLKDNGNVFINEKLDLDFIESKVGFKVTVRDCVGGGYVYERVK